MLRVLDSPNSFYTFFFQIQPYHSVDFLSTVHSHKNTETSSVSDVFFVKFLEILVSWATGYALVIH